MTPHQSASSFFVFSKDLNYGGTLFGGKLLAEMDCEASKVARSVVHGSGADGVVTACFDRVDFRAPARVGDLVVIEADLRGLGTTSMVIALDAWVKVGPRRADWTHICSATATFVAMRGGRPHPHGGRLEGTPTKND